MHCDATLITDHSTSRLSLYRKSNSDQHGKDRNWKMRQERRTPRHTTHVDEMVVMRS